MARSNQGSDWHLWERFTSHERAKQQLIIQRQKQHEYAWRIAQRKTLTGQTIFSLEYQHRG